MNKTHRNMNYSGRCGLLAFSMFILSSCLVQSPSDYNRDVLLAGKGIWNIDELKVTEVSPVCGCVVEDTTYYNYGTLTFSGNKNAPQYEMEKTIPFDTYVLGPISGPADIYSTDIVLNLGTGTGILSSFIDAEIVKINKKELILFCPWSLNTITDEINDVDFYFKCTKQ